MGSLTEDCPKPLIPVNNVPFLLYVLNRLYVNNIKDIGIVTGYKSEIIHKFVDDLFLQKVLNITFIHQEAQLGTGHAVSLCEEFVGDNEFILMNGDSLFSANDIGQLMAVPGSAVTCKKVRHPEGYGVIIQHPGNDQLLHCIVEKPEKPTSNLVNVGLYKLNPDIFNHLRLLKPSTRGELELPDAINSQARKYPIFFHFLTDYWLDFGCPEDIPKVEEKLNEINASQYRAS